MLFWLKEVMGSWLGQVRFGWKMNTFWFGWSL